MKKFIHTRESDFKETEFNYEDEIVEVAEKLRKISEENFDSVLPTILSNDDGTKLKFSINMGKDRLEKEMGNHLYRISIEKIIC